MASPATTPYCWNSIEDLGIKKQFLDVSYQKEEWFYKYKDNTICPYYREDIKKVINPYKPCTFFPFLKEFDIPFVESYWLHLIKMTLEKRRDLNNIFGKYLAWCKLNDIKHLTFKDSNKFFADGYEYKSFEYKLKIIFEVGYSF